MQVTVGGERLGSGKKLKVNMREYERSTHDLSYVWRSTAAAGTLIPFMSEVTLPGDTFDIDLDCEVLTHPTIGPLFGTYKVQLDVFQVPVRLYQGQLHMNLLDVGLKMNQVALPVIELYGQVREGAGKPLDNSQVNPSSIFKYLGISGLGMRTQDLGIVSRTFNAVPYLGYWDIYKNYYANKQENTGRVLHTPAAVYTPTITGATLVSSTPAGNVPIAPAAAVFTNYVFTNETYMRFSGIGLVNGQVPRPELIDVGIEDANGNVVTVKANQIFRAWLKEYNGSIVGTSPYINTSNWPGTNNNQIKIGRVAAVVSTNANGMPNITQFPLSNIDDMRKAILRSTGNTVFEINTDYPEAPYILPLDQADTAGVLNFSLTKSQEGLALKTYQSDLFNNWIQTEWIDGQNSIAEITAVSTTGDSFTIDEFNLKSKIYMMLNRIAISGGTYDDWLDAVYTHDRQRSAENPMYLGGMMQTLTFQEVISNSQSDGQPLGTLAGRGKLVNNKKGGRIVAKIDEPSYLIGIVSITPHIDYSQGNKWDVNLKTMDDFHKPGLDEIGFEDLITDQMAWWDTGIVAGVPQFRSAGKQPAWINYMTNVNRVYGNFAEPGEQMFMVLTRQYTPLWNQDELPEIFDLTTYVDPSKYNTIFADTSLDSQNFWVQIAVGIEARRKMSAKVMPNL